MLKLSSMTAGVYRYNPVKNICSWRSMGIIGRTSYVLWNDGRVVGTGYRPLVGLLVLLLPFFYSGMSAQSYWLRLETPGANEITCLHQCGGAVLSGTRGGIYLSVDAGASWIEVTNNAVPIVEIASNSTGLCAATTPYGPLISTDGGFSWNPTALHVGTFGVAVSENGDIIVAAGAWDESASTYLSTDRGLTWDRRIVRDPGMRSGYFGEMLLTKEGTLLATERWYQIIGQSWFRRSTDMGLSWERPGIANGALPVSCSGGLVQDAAGRLFCGSTNGGFLYSTDDGQSWNAVHPGWPPNGALNVILAATDGSIYACGNLLHNLPDTSLSSWRIVDTVSFTSMLEPAEGVLLGGNATGIYRSDGHGRGWISSTDGMRAQVVTSLSVDGNDDLWCAGAVSHDHGRSWEERLSSEHVEYFFSGPDGWWFAGRHWPPPLMWRSADGRNWEEVTSLPGRIINVYEMKQAGRWLLCAGQHGVLRSCDHGGSWESLIATNVNRVTEDKEGRLYVSTFYSGVKRSDTAWKNWESVNDGLLRDEYGNIFSYALACGPEGTLYCSVLKGGGLFRSRDGGDSWERILDEEVSIRDILVLDEDRIFLATDGLGVLISEDGGENWFARNDGLSNLSINSLDIDDAGYLYAATTGSGVFRSARSLHPCSRDLLLSSDDGLRGFSGEFIDIPLHLRPQLLPYDDLVDRKSVV